MSSARQKPLKGTKVTTVANRRGIREENKKPK